MPSIRNIAVALPAKDGHVLVQRGHDAVKDQHFYRALGGGIEFGELAADALCREFQEELGIELDHVELLDVVENIFVYEGTAGHEIAHAGTEQRAEKELTHPSVQRNSLMARWLRNSSPARVEISSLRMESISTSCWTLVTRESQSSPFCCLRGRVLRSSTSRHAVTSPAS